MGSSQSSHAYVENGRRFLKNAQQLDHAACNTQNGELYKEAMNNYYSAVECIKKALENEKDSKRREILQDNMELCLNRVELLKIWNPVGGKCGAPKLLEMKKLEKSKENDESDDHDDKDGGGKKSSRAVLAESDGTTTSEDTKVLRDDAVDGSAMYTLGVELGKKATEEDKIACAAADPELYDLAKRTYHSAVDYFRSALKYEKVPKAIANIEDKIQEYLDRADILGAWAAAKKQTKSAVSSAVAAVKASDSQGSTSRKKSEKIVATTATKPQFKKEQRHVQLEPKKTDSVTSVRGSVRSKESSKSQKSADSKKANNPKPTSSTSKKRSSEPKDGNVSGGSSVRSKQTSANSKQSNTSKKGSSSSKSVPKKGGTDGKKESSGTKKTSASKSKQTKPNSKATTTKSRETCKCGYKSKRREKSGTKK